VFLQGLSRKGERGGERKRARFGLADAGRIRIGKEKIQYHFCEKKKRRRRGLIRRPEREEEKKKKKRKRNNAAARAGWYSPWTTFLLQRTAGKRIRTEPSDEGVKKGEGEKPCVLLRRGCSSSLKKRHPW